MSEQPVSYAEFVRLVVEAMEAAGVAYLIGGAVASWAWGEPRSTLDLDLVVDVPLETVGRLSQELEKRDMLAPEEIILDTLIEDRADLPVNAIHLNSGFKADVYLIRDRDELRRTAFSRRVKVNLGPPIGEVYVHSPEDLLIYKIWYFSLSRQNKHVRDIAAILRLNLEGLDFKYLQFWVERKGLQATWQEILRLVEETH